MSASQIRHEIVRRVLKEMGPELWTKDLSERSEMRAGHPTLAGHRSYHAFVGAFLSQFADVEIVPDVRHASRGARWRNKLAREGLETASEANRSGAPTPTRRAASGAVELGPQCAGDNPFTARMRLHQSWYRAAVLGVPCGVGPTPRSSSRYGNMLLSEDANRGFNFLSPSIYEVVRQRLSARSGKVEPFRLLHNMLSSQPMCFNLFAPLVRDRALAARLLSSLLGLDVAEVLDVQIEYAPEPAHEYLGDSTAFDAFIDYRLCDGKRAFLGIETKLTEPFSVKHYDGPAYRRWMSSEQAPWRSEAHATVDRVEHNQLWRDHLLAVSLLRHPDSPFSAGTLMLVRHPGDASCARVTDGYRRLLHEGDETFVDMPLDVLLARWRAVASEPHEQEWLTKLATRYLDLEQSAEAASSRREG